jgi:hypothetical protein
MQRRTFLHSAAAVAASSVLFQSLFESGHATPVNSGDAEPGWWMTEPIRWPQTNLRETNSALDPKQFIRDVARGTPVDEQRASAGANLVYAPER